MIEAAGKKKPTEVDLHRFMLGFQDANGRAPSRAEAGDALGVARSVVGLFLGRLAKDGLAVKAGDGRGAWLAVGAARESRAPKPDARRRKLTDEELKLTDAQRDFAEANVKLVYKVASRFGVDPEASDEAAQAGFSGLFRAVQKFEPSRGVKFSTYAYPYIYSAIQEHLRRSGVVYVSYHESRKRKASGLSRSPAAVSMEADDRLARWDFYADPKPFDPIKAERESFVRAAVEGLGYHERAVIQARMEGKGLTEIACDLDRNRPWVESVESAAHAKLREMLRDYA